MSVPKDRDVLPTNVKPTNYHVTLEPHLEDLKFSGAVKIDLEVVKETSVIHLHALELDIQNTRVWQNNEILNDDPKVDLDAEKQTMTVTLPSALPAGSKVTLDVSFAGVLNDNMVGFYRSAYKDGKGNSKFMATSQMEATDCRRAFPCIDEPAVKSTFTITLVADSSLTCLSNMNEVSRKETSSFFDLSIKKDAVTFAPTPVMSTYLLCFIVGEFNYIETRSFRIPVRVYAPPDQDIEHGRFALDLAARTLDFYEKEFDQPFPLPKMDMIAIPDFAAGAMENWGLVTYRVVDILLSEETAGAGTRQRVAETVQHELAHQWFGNLVTMDWWEGLWLNEGFATWMSWYACNAFFPEWKVWESYVKDDYQSALSLDSLRSSHPIEVPVQSADQIGQIFDAISYSKGSCVLRMISKFLGEQTFLAGIRRYLKRHAYGNTATKDLWTALGEESGKDVERVMEIWTKNVGFPVVKVAENSGDKSIHVQQNRFLRTADVKPDEDKVLYPVSLGIRTKDGVDEDTLLNGRETTIKLKDLEFFKLNADQSGLYRTLYTPDRLAKLGVAASQGLLSTEDRAGLVADAGALSASGHQRTSGFLSLLHGFGNEREYVVWEELAGWLSGLRAAFVFEDQATKDAIQAFQLDLVSERVHEAGWAFKRSDGHVQQQYKATLFGFAVGANDKKVLEAAYEMFEKFKHGDRKAIHPNLRMAVYHAVLKRGEVKDYDVIYQEAISGPTSEERNAALRSLGRAQNPELIQRTLELPLSNHVKNQDIYLPLGGLRSHAAAIEALFEWMQKNWDEILKAAPPSMPMLSSVVQICIGSLTKPEQLQRVHAFFDNKNQKGYDQGLKQSIDAITARIKWVERDGNDVRNWLREHKYLN